MKNKKDIRVIILAAGKGVRMGGDLPKVLAPVKGKPMIRWVLSAVKQSGVDPNPIVIVGYKKELVLKEIGKQREYAEQKEQLGTGHAVSLARSLLEEKANNIMIL